MTEFHYRIPWRTRNAHPGHHLSSQSGGEHEFYGHAPLLSRPEPHNLDIHASLMDPFQQYVVRTFRQRGIINVLLVADLSASMGFENKMQVLADFTAKTAYSVYRSGDHFGLFGCEHKINTDLFLPTRWYKGGVPEMTSKLSTYVPSSQSCRSFFEIPDHLPRQRSLVFLVSDYHFPLSDISRLFDSLARHDVIPVILWHEQEYLRLPPWGLIRLHDPETRRDRHLFMRPRLKAKIIHNFARRKKQLIHLLMRYGRQPFFIGEHFNPDQMTRYFYEQ